MKKIAANIALLVVAFALQSCVFPFVPFLSVSPNFVLILTFSYGFIYGPGAGLGYGLMAGLILDLFHSGAFGFFSLFFMWIGYMNGCLSRYYYENYIALPLFLCTINEFLYNFYIYLLRFFIRGKMEFLFYFRTIILPEIIISLLFTLLIYRFFLWYNRKLEILDQKRAVN
ncbi:MAG: rod shape-determining protein MreD [Stomatobaculum sp.]